MKVSANILWVLLGGLWLALLWGLYGVLFCITIVGIPFGMQCFKMAGLAVSPYGKRVKTNFSKHPVANILWLIVGGWEMAIAHLIFGIISCLTIIGISRGIQCFKLMKLAFLPFGAEVVRVKA